MDAGDLHETPLQDSRKMRWFSGENKRRGSDIVHYKRTEVQNQYRSRNGILKAKIIINIRKLTILLDWKNVKA